MAAGSDGGAGSPTAGDQTLCRQNLQRFANRLAAYPVCLGKLGLTRQQLSLRDAPRDNLTADLVSNLTMQGTGRVKPAGVQKTSACRIKLTFTYNLAAISVQV